MVQEELSPPKPTRKTLQDHEGNTKLTPASKVKDVKVDKILENMEISCINNA